MDKREHSHGPLPPECWKAQVALETHLVAGDALGATRDKALESHLASCEACADFETIARHLSELPPRSNAMVRDRSVIAARTRYFKRRQNRRIATEGIAVAAAAALVWGIFPILFTAKAPETENVTGQPLAAGVRLEMLDGRVTLNSSVHTRLETVLATQDDMNIRIDGGFVCAHIDPASKRRVHFRVETPLGAVTVKGTAFGVTVADGDVRVAVVRGEVAASPIDAPRPYSVSAGSVFDFGTRRTTPIADAADERIRTLLGLPPKEADATGKPGPPDEDTSVREPPNDETDTAVPKKSVSKPRQPQHVPLGTLLDEADRCRIAHDWSCAANRYRTIVKRFPNRAEAATALVNLGQIQLKHLKNPRGARRNFERYQTQRPSGPLSEQALMGVARANRALGDYQREARALNRFVVQHPSSPLAQAARRRLTELEKNN